MEPISATTPIPQGLVTERRRASFESLYREHRDDVLGWALRFSAGRTAWAEDVAHDVFLQLHRHLKHLDPDDLGGWLYRVTANEALARLRRESSWVRRVVALLVPFAAPEQPDEALERKTSSSEAIAALEALPAKERIAVTMHLLDGLSQREIARTLNLSEGYVSKLLSRAFARLRERGWEVDHVE